MLYIGLPDKRKSYFDDPQTQLWLQKQGSRSFEQLLFHTYPRACTISSAPADDENPLWKLRA